LAQEVLEELDKLVPVPKHEPEIKPLQLREAVKSEEVESVIEKIRVYFRRYNGVFDVEIRIKPKE
jgi:hypothetical protein